MKNEFLNFFRDQRLKLNLSVTQMAARCDTTAVTIVNWERDETIPSKPIALLAAAFEVPESRMEREVMALRRRIEAKRAPVAVAAK